ncbi:MAG: EAL domain-containing protein [Oscillospiraceae bacterium]|nr:EAL domain-containing protein [Oscillospiraceae bacterium]
MLVFLIVSVADRRMRSDAAGNCFKLLLVITLITTVCDMWSIAMNITAEAGGLPNLFLLYFCNTLYLLFHNLTIPAYMLFVIAFTNTWHKLKGNKPIIAAMTVPSLCIIAVLLINLFTGKIFCFDENHVYHRGDHIIVLYILAFINMVVCTAYIFKYKKLFSAQKFIAMLSMLPLEFLAVLIQMFVPNLLVEMFANAVALFLVLTTVQRPEEIQESVTLLKNFNAYTTDVRQDFSNKRPFVTIIINISNFVALHQILGYDSANELLKLTAERLVDINNELKTQAEIYHIQKGKFRFVVSGERIKMAETAAERITEELKKSINVSGMGLNLLAYVCMTACPDDIGDLRTLLRFGMDYHERLPYTGQVLRASELVGRQGFELGSAIDEIIDRAIANKGFKVYYQPIYSVAEKKFVSAEALLRLKDEKYGFISPELFIVAAERSGAIHKIGDYVMDEVCRFIASDE